MPLQTILLSKIGNAIPWVSRQNAIPFVSLFCHPDLKNDDIAMGNTLARSINTYLKSELIGQGMPWQYGVTMLQVHAKALGEMTMVLYFAENAPDLAYQLCSLPHMCVYLHYTGDLPKHFEDHPFLITLGDVSTLQKATPRMPRSQAGLRERLKGNLCDKKWLDAFNIAASLVPDAVEDVLNQAGWYLMAQGASERLFTALGELPEPHRENPTVLRWRLAAAYDLWRQGEMLETVGRVLQTQEHAELRALYALSQYSMLNYTESRRQIEQALTVERSALVLAIAGNISINGDISGSLRYLTAALKQAELENLPLLQTQIAIHLSEAYIFVNDLKATVKWAEWAIRLMGSNNLNHTPIRLLALNQLVSARLYQGDTLGLEAQLRQEAASLEKVNPRMRNVLEGTLAELLSFEGRNEEALAIWKPLWDRLRQRESLAMFAVPYVRTLLEFGHHNEAEEVAQQALTLNHDSAINGQALARLALAICRALKAPSTVLNELPELIRIFENWHMGFDALRAEIHLIRVLLIEGHVQEAIQLVERLRPVAKHFGKGLAALVGPTAELQEVFSLFGQEKTELELEFLGGNKARLRGFPLSLRQRQADVLGLLALRPLLNTEELALGLYGEEGSVGTTRTEVNRLKTMVPIENRPYRIALPFEADFLSLSKCLGLGDVRGALNLYRGPLLPSSTAPGIEEERRVLEQALREAVLASNDGEAILAMAELLGDDLELWEYVVEQLPKIDPRRAIAEARRRSIASNWQLN